MNTHTKKAFTSYFLSAEVHVEDKSVLVLPTPLRNFATQYDSIRLRDTAEAMLAAADLLDSLK